MMDNLHEKKEKTRYIDSTVYVKTVNHYDFGTWAYRFVLLIILLGIGDALSAIAEAMA